MCWSGSGRPTNRACQFFCVWGLEVGGDSVGVGGGELGEGLFPVGGGVPLDEAGVSCSFVGGFASVCEALGGAFVFDVANSQPQEFDGGFFAGEMPAVLGDFTQLVVQRFDSVGGVHDAAQHGRERQERREALPGLVWSCARWDHRPHCRSGSPDAAFSQPPKVFTSAPYTSGGASWQPRSCVVVVS